MNYFEIDTAEDLLNAFKACQNAGEEIQLFESLAEREHPPVDAFVEILRKIKLETVLALAIQAFGKITNDDVKATLKGSEDLLVMLCEKAKSGATDLIRWSAATTIEKVGFSFIDVCQHLTEEPSGIIQRIVQSKVRVLTDADRNRHGITENNDYDSFIRFWVYGATYELRAATVNSGGGNAAIVVNAVVKSQGIWGIKQTNALFFALENLAQNPLHETAKQVCGNHFFEIETQSLSSEILCKSHDLNCSEIVILNQIYCLQGNNQIVRKKAAAVIVSLENYVLDALKAQYQGLSSILTVLSQDYFGDRVDFCYQELVKFIRCLEIADRHWSRDEVRKYFQELRVKSLNAIKNREDEINREINNVVKTKSAIEKHLFKIHCMNHQVYLKYQNIDSELIPTIDVQSSDWHILLSNYHQSLHDKSNMLDQITRKLSSDSKYEFL